MGVGFPDPGEGNLVWSRQSEVEKFYNLSPSESSRIQTERSEWHVDAVHKQPGLSVPVRLVEEQDAILYLFLVLPNMTSDKQKRILTDHSSPSYSD